MRFDPEKPLTRSIGDAVALSSMVGSLLGLVSDTSEAESSRIGDAINGIAALQENLTDFLSDMETKFG